MMAVGLLLPAMLGTTISASEVDDREGDALLPPGDGFVYEPGALVDVQLGDAPGGAAGGAGDVPDAYAQDTSDYMLGDAVLSVVFLESDGSEEPESEDWSAARKDEVRTGIRDGMDFWEDQAPGRFDVKMTTTTVPTGVEPIRHNAYTGGECDNQFVWINDAMEELGYDPGVVECQGDGWDWTTWNAVRSYAHDLRNAHDRDWGYVAFVVDSLDDDDGTFADGKFAYAYRNGPFTVLTYDNDGYGIDKMDEVAAHETGHIFGATDEYTNPGEVWGYLWERETDDSGCIMDDSSWCVSPGSAGQLGWRDGDGDGLMDPVDTRPDVDGVDLTLPGDVTQDDTPAFAGTARDIPFPAHEEFRKFGFHNISVNNVMEVAWTVDGGPASSEATERADPHAASWRFETAPLADGTHTVTLRAVNEVDGSDASPVVDEVTVDTTGPQVEIVDPAPGRIYWAGSLRTDNPQGGNETPVIVGNLLYVNATADDGLTWVDRVDLYIDGDLRLTNWQPPYEQTLFVPHLPGTTHELTVVARDVAGNTVSVNQTYRAAP